MGSEIKVFDRDIKISIIGPGIGDVLMGLGTAHSLADEGIRVSFVAQPKFHDLIRSCPHVYNVTDIQGKEDIWLTAAWHHFQKGHQVDNYNKYCGLFEVDNNSKSIDIITPVEIQSLMAHQFPGKDRLVIHPSGRDLGKRWPPEYWQQLIDKFCAEDIEVISIGMLDWLGTPTYKFDGCINYLDSPVFETIELLRHSALLISACSGPIQIAGATDCGILGLYSLMPPESRLPYRHGELGWNAKGLMPTCEYAPCFEKMVTPNDFIWSDEAERRQKEENITLGQLMETWCLNKEAPYSCMTTITVDEVFNEAMKLYKANI